MNEILGVGLKMGLFLHVVAVSPSDATLDEVRLTQVCQDLFLVRVVHVVYLGS